MKMKSAFTGCILLAGLALGACANTPTTLTPAEQSVAQLGVTVASIAAQNNTTVAKIVSDGQLFCQYGGTIVAVVDSLSNPTTVVGKAAAIVAQACPIIAGIQTVPTPPPANPASVPVVPVAAAAPIAATG